MLRRSSIVAAFIAGAVAVSFTLSLAIPPAVGGLAVQVGGTPKPGTSTVNFAGVSSSGPTAGVLTITTAAGVPPTRTIATTSPLTGGGDLSANRTIGIDLSAAGLVGDVGGVVSGNALEAIQGYAVSTSVPLAGQVLKYDTTSVAWINAPLLSSTGVTVANVGGGGITFAVDQAFTPTWTGLHSFNVGTTPADAVELAIAAPGSNGTRDSHSLVFQGRSYDGSAHSVLWRQWNHVAANAGTTSAVLWSLSVDGAGATTKAGLNNAGAFMASDGTTSAPSYQGLSGNSTGLNIAGSTVQIATNGTQALTVDASQVSTFASTVVSTAFRTSTATVTTAGGNATPTLTANSCGAAGQPTSGTQSGWVKMQDSTGATIWLPFWK